MSIVLKGYQRDYLTRNAHQLQPVVMIGRNGLSPEVLKAIDQALDLHELIKVKFQDFKEEKKDLAYQVTQEMDATLVRIIGNIAIFYRYQPDPTQRIMHLPK